MCATGSSFPQTFPRSGPPPIRQNPHRLSAPATKQDRTRLRRLKIPTNTPSDVFPADPNLKSTTKVSVPTGHIFETSFLMFLSSMPSHSLNSLRRRMFEFCMVPALIPHPAGNFGRSGKAGMPELRPLQFQRAQANWKNSSPDQDISMIRLFPRRSSSTPRRMKVLSCQFDEGKVLAFGPAARVFLPLFPCRWPLDLLRLYRYSSAAIFMPRVLGITLDTSDSVVAPFFTPLFPLANGRSLPPRSPGATVTAAFRTPRVPLLVLVSLPI